MLNKIEFILSMVRSFFGLYSDTMELRERYVRYLEIVGDVGMGYDGWSRLTEIKVSNLNVATLNLSIFPDDILSIQIDNSSIDIVDIDGLFPRLHTLSINGCGIKDVRGIINVPSLKTFSAGENQLSEFDIALLGRKLNLINLSDNPLGKVGMFKEGTKCRSLNIMGTGLVSIPIAANSKFETVYVSSNTIPQTIHKSVGLIINMSTKYL